MQGKVYVKSGKYQVAKYHEQFDSNVSLNLHLFTTEDKSLLSRRNTFLLFDTFFYALHFIIWLDVNFNLQKSILNKNVQCKQATLTSLPVRVCQKEKQRFGLRGVFAKQQQDGSYLDFDQHFFK